MAAKSLVPVEEYLRLSFDGPDREYLDGEIVERSFGSKSHSEVQARLILAMHDLIRQRQLSAFPEIRLKVSETRYRIVDLAVYEGSGPNDEIPSTPPHITIEIVSRDDRYTEIMEKLDEYRRWGVPHVWLADPYLCKLYLYGSAGLAEVAALEAPEYGLQIRIGDLQ